MAINIVDRDKLDAALTATASAIRSKTGSSASIAFDIATDMGFKSAIESIPSGGEDNFKYATTCSRVFQNAAIPDSMVFDIRNSTDLSYMFYVASGGGTIDITLGKAVTNITYFLGHQANDGKSTVTKLRIAGDLSAVTNYIGFALYCANLTEVDADLDFRSVSNGNNFNLMFYTANVIPLRIRFVPNTLSLSLKNQVINSRTLDDDSLVSLANCLKAVSETVYLNTSNKQRITTLLGTVSQRTDDTGTYDFFTADAGGSVSLQSFITQTKGWTIA